MSEPIGTVEHHLKCVDPYFSDVESGLKGYEIRKNDRDYKVGDILVLHHYSPTAIIQSGRMVRRKVVQMIRDFVGLADGYVALGLESAPPPSEREKKLVEALRDLDMLLTNWRYPSAEVQRLNEFSQIIRKALAAYRSTKEEPS